MSKQKRSKGSENKAVGTVYDDAFKTLLLDCPRLLIPVVNKTFDRGLYFPLPFYIFVHEKQLAVYNENDKERETLTDEYVRFMEALDQALVRGQISVFERGTILDKSRRVLQRIAAKYGKVQEGVGEIMGGRVLEYETKTAYNAGKAEGKAEGIIEGETEAKKRTARKMHAMGMDIKTIAEIIDVEENVVEEWLK